LIFVEVTREVRPDIPCVTLAKTLGMINSAGLTNEYKRMYFDYRDTGIFEKDILRRVGEVTNSRYLVQLKLADYNQYTQGRWGFLGFRMMETKRANTRLFFQIWDSTDGTIAWEGVEEISYSYDTYTEQIVTFEVVVKSAAKKLIALLP